LSGAVSGDSCASPGPARCLACASSRADPWATAVDVEYRTSEDRFAFHHCRDCGALFIDPVPRDRLREIYPANYYSFAAADRSLVHRAKRVLDAQLFRGLLRRLPGERLSALDVGGGSGEELSTLRAVDRRVTRTVVVDPAEGAAAAARQRGHEYVQRRIEDFTSAEPFDLVLMLNIIEHVEAPLAVLERVKRLLSPDGILVVKTPNHDSLDARLFRHANWGGYHCPRHWVLFTRESFVGLASRAGLGLREFAYTQGAPFWAVSVLAWLAARGCISVTRQRPVARHALFLPVAAVFAAFDFARRPWAKTSQMFLVLAADRRP
jgi:SAM-dependent methyltransferase